MSSQNMSSAYRESEQIFHPEFVAFNQNDSTVRLYMKVLPSELLFERQEDQGFRAVLHVHAAIINSYEMFKVIDSVSAEFKFDLSEKSQPQVISLDIPFDKTGQFLIHCYFNDRVKKTDEDFFISLERDTVLTRQDFLVTDDRNIPLFRNYVTSIDTINILQKNGVKESLWCKYYIRDFQLAAPPFNFDMHQDFDYRPDSMFQVSQSDLSNFTATRPGFYHFQRDTSGKQGLTIFRFYTGFPAITTPQQMIESSRYLLSRKEYEELKNSSSPKTAIDNFWLTHGGTEEKTRNLIKKYYSRIKEANKYFTSYTEGWRTDRGMIYAIFGSPGTIYRSSESESWIYGTPNSSLALNFFFVKVNNPFSNNDFMLTRSPTYESSWYRAVEVWRQGRAYNSFY